MEAEIKDFLEFLANKKNWESPSTGFAAFYDPSPSPIGHGAPVINKAKYLLKKFATSSSMVEADTLLMRCIVINDQRERAKGKHPWILTVKNIRTGEVQEMAEREYYLNDEEAQADIPRLNEFFKGMVTGDFDVVSLVEEK